jgi:hypothetical protein
MQAIFESSDVADLVGISPIYLNKFVERGLYGIAPSERMLVGRGGRRWFNEEDVFGIALVWWLFEAGLRSQVINRILGEIVGQKKANANRAAKTLREEGVQFLAISRVPRLGEGKQPKRMTQTVDTLDKSELLDLIEATRTKAVHVIPVGDLFSNLRERILEEFG